MERTIQGYRFDDAQPIAVGVSSTTYRAVREGAADVSIPVTIKVIDLRSTLDDTGKRPAAELLDSTPLQHACIVDVRDVIQMGRGRVGIVRELVDGWSLVQLLDRLQEQPLLPPAALFIGKQCASALAYAHARNAAHGDFCHRHVLLSRDGQVKVSDFQVLGLLSLASRAETRLRMGKRYFQAPEQCARPAPPPTIETDVFALGVLLYRMLTGAYPFADVEALLEHIPPDFQVTEEDWGPQASKLLAECLSYEKELRPPAGEVERRLRRILGPNWPGYGITELAEYLAELDRSAPIPTTVPVATTLPSQPVEEVILVRRPDPQLIAAADRESQPGGPAPRRGPPEVQPPPLPPEPAGTGPDSTQVGQRSAPRPHEWNVAPPPPLPPVSPPPALRIGDPVVILSKEPAASAGPPRVVLTKSPDPAPPPAVQRGGQRPIPLKDISVRLPNVEARVAKLEALVIDLLGRSARANESQLDLAELTERVNSLENANTYLARELENLRDRFEALLAALGKIAGEH